MKKISLFIAVSLLFVWCLQYLRVNNGCVLPYPYHMHTIIEHGIGDVIDLSGNDSYYGADYDGLSISVESSEIINKDVFSNRYNINFNAYSDIPEKYLELDVIITNTLTVNKELIFDGLIVRGDDWCSYLLSDITFIINNSEYIKKDEYGRLENIYIEPKQTIKLTLIYGLYENLFAKDRWVTLDNEKFWLILTLTPIEHRIKVNQ